MLRQDKGQLQAGNLLPDEEKVKEARQNVMSKVREIEKQEIQQIKNKQTPEMQRSLDLLSEPGASSWLSALPIAAQEFDLGKGEFQDALCLRYNMPIRNLPETCPCTKNFSVTYMPLTATKAGSSMQGMTRYVIWSANF